MSTLSNFKQFLECTSPLNIYLEYNDTPLSSREDSFVTIGINSEECSYDIKNSLENFSKDKIAFIVRVIMSKDTNVNVITHYFDTYILNPLMKSIEFNILSVKKDTPHYTKYLDKMELTTTIIVECINLFD